MNRPASPANISIKTSSALQAFLSQGNQSVSSDWKQTKTSQRCPLSIQVSAHFPAYGWRSCGWIGRWASDPMHFKFRFKSVLMFCSHLLAAQETHAIVEIWSPSCTRDEESCKYTWEPLWVFLDACNLSCSLVGFMWPDLIYQKIYSPAKKTTRLSKSCPHRKSLQSAHWWGPSQFARETESPSRQSSCQMWQKTLEDEAFWLRKAVSQHVCVHESKWMAHLEWSSSSDIYYIQYAFQVWSIPGSHCNLVSRCMTRRSM